MKIGIIGASGKVGNLVLKEAVSRGHDVTAIVRDASKLTDHNTAIIEKNVFDLKTEDLLQFDVVVNAFGAPLGEEQAHVDAGHTLIKALKGTKTRLIVVGGAGSLYVDENKTVRLIDTPEFPDFVKPTAKGQGRNLEELLQTTDLTWTFISPAAIFDAEGKRTGSYQEGEDHLLVNSKGESYISYADYAIALVDEIENAKHLNKRFTVAGEAE
ncbi:NAD(P)-dependent oxidoreductase [Lysinibacillus yapensis]|uniref:NAD(P)-dependent oxidoreductase n=1 Tax=Ureibacillus yapensis TaxID=2304605 RepID=A0A396S3W4_9BACL|nr:NAD(P)-dependent oxidoreductase [Lysinibacillus yapensis]RHW33394.1 NAD(P)-dependent oxidoreductase [Lysinibacillus yapensis]